MSHMGVLNVRKLHSTYGCGAILGHHTDVTKGSERIKRFRISHGHGQWSKDPDQDTFVTHFSKGFCHMFFVYRALRLGHSVL